MLTAHPKKMGQLAQLAPQVLTAPPNWQSVDVISDLHLSPGDPHTFDAWRRYMENTPADAVFILGDWFDVWIGDDALPGDAAHPPREHDGFELSVARVVSRAAQRLAVWVMHGNRDFLMGQGFLARCSAQLLADPTVFEFDGKRWALTHGDALCTDDAAYMAFRAQVREPAWQANFLGQSLSLRREQASAMREASKVAQQTKEWVDVNLVDAVSLAENCDADTLIHGHTHEGKTHNMALKASSRQIQRIVTLDWDASTSPPRLQVLRLSKLGAQRIDLPTASSAINAPDMKAASANPPCSSF